MRDGRWGPEGSLEKGRPGGMRDGHMLRFAEADTAVARLYCSVPLTQLSPQGAGRIQALGAFRWARLQNSILDVRCVISSGDPRLSMYLHLHFQVSP